MKKHPHKSVRTFLEKEVGRFVAAIPPQKVKNGVIRVCIRRSCDARTGPVIKRRRPEPL